MGMDICLRRTGSQLAEATGAPTRRREPDAAASCCGGAASRPDSRRPGSAPLNRRKARHGLEVVEIHRIAHILLRGVAERLEIPGVGPAPAERRVDETATALVSADAPVQFGEVPALRDLGAKVGDEACARGVVREVRALPGIVHKVEQLVRIGGRVDELVAARGGSSRSARSPLRPDIRRSPRRGLPRRADGARGCARPWESPPNACRRPQARRGSA